MLDAAAVFLLTGPPAAGKTTVGKLLAERFPRGVHIEGDFYRRCVVAGRAEITPELCPEALTQLRLRYRLGAMAADAYFSEGFTVVLEDVIAGPLLSECAALIKSRPLHVIVLLPSADIVRARDDGRSDTGYSTWSIHELHDAFTNDTPRLGMWLDSSGQSPNETVERILAFAKRA
jgi:chloramphenicol 3-O-phosphotransferase